MENAGLITFRESALLEDPLQGGLADRADAAAIIAHEMAHMVHAFSVRQALWWMHSMAG